MWKKICAVMAAILAFILGLFSFLYEHKKRKIVEEQLKQNEEKLKEKEEEIQKEKGKDKKYADYKKQNEELMASAISGDADADIRILQNAAESGRRRNKH